MKVKAPVAMFACPECSDDAMPSEIGVGANEEGNLVVVCVRHRAILGTFALVEPIDISAMTCEVCGQRFVGGQLHRH